jgi:GAF domain-containing protein
MPWTWPAGVRLLPERIILGIKIHFDAAVQKPEIHTPASVLIAAPRPFQRFSLRGYDAVSRAWGGPRATAGEAMKKRRSMTTGPKRRNAPEVARRGKPSAGDANEKLALLKRERDEALEREAATAEVLKVISRSTFDLKAALKTVVQLAGKLCQAENVQIFLRDGEFHRLAADNGFSPEYQQYVREHPIRPGRGTLVARTALGVVPVQIPDRLADPEYTYHEGASLGGYRTMLGVPLVRDGNCIGVIALTRSKVQPFTDKQIALVQNFAAQAIIAIENTRLLNELRHRTDDLTEALEQQTATSEVLKVISSSPGELDPVFNALLSNATRICEATFGTLFLREGPIFRAVAVHSKQSFADFLRVNPVIDLRDNPGIPLDRLSNTKQLVHIPDFRTDQSYIEKNSFIVPLVEVAGARTFVSVPMLKDGELIGSINMYRQEVRPFTDKQVEVVQNFAAQAVIAIENTRLLKELRESLQQQTATADVLRVISRSPTDVQPVLNAILETAGRLCESEYACFFKLQDGKYHLAGSNNAKAEYIKYLSDHPISLDRGSLVGRTALECRTVHIPDCLADPEYTSHEYARAGKHRSMLGVPLLRDGVPVGVIGLLRTSVKAYTDKQVELVTTFADQAVIALENVRLFTETKEALEQQTATSEVLKVISSSPGELEPVFSAMLANATRICEATFGNLYLCEGLNFHGVATHSEQSYADYWRRNPVINVRDTPGVPLDRLANTKRVVHIHDLRTDQSYIGKNERIVALVEVGGMRTFLAVPMLKEGELIGSINMYRQEVRPFTDKQIDLVKNFAAQAVIAIENTRLLKELRQRTDDLSEALEQQTATSEVLRVISSSPGELEPVFEAMLENAVRICGAKFGNLWLREGDAFRVGATHGAPQAYVDYLHSQDVFHPDPRVGLGQVLRTKEPFQVADVAAAPTHGDKSRQALVELAGGRTLIGVPMLKDNEVVGAIGIYRQEVRPFTDKQIELVKNFAAQAVIAIENTRLLNELRESLQQQTATADVLKVISSSPGELEPVFQTMLENATRVCGAKFGTLYLYDGDSFHATAFHNAPPAFMEDRKRAPLHPGPNTSLGLAAKTKQVAQIVDITKWESYLQRDPFAVAGADLGGYRTVVSVPMLKEDKLIGVISVYRQEVLSFTDKQIELVKNFAAQAVIAIENTRLLNELRESLQQQTATADVLKVISRSTFDLQTVLNTLVKSAATLCEAYDSSIWQADGERLILVAHYGPITVESLPLVRGIVAGRTVLDGRTFHIADLQNAADEFPESSENARRWGFRAILCVPLMREGIAIGLIGLRRTEAQVFTERQVALLQTFADQAVIAVENARLLNELRESLEQQTATSEVLQVISGSAGELQPVFNTMLENAVRICEAKFGSLLLVEGDAYRNVALYGAPQAFLEERQRHPIIRPRPGSDLDRVKTTKQIIHIPDMQVEGAATTAIVELAGARTFLNVPMLKDDELIGVIGIYRQDVQPFTDKQIELVTNFAAQAVIAIENARLLNELRQRTADLSKSLEDLRAAQDRLVQTEKLASLGQLTAGIAHEIKNPLNFVNNFSGVSVELIDELQEILQRVKVDDKTRTEITELTDTLRGNLDKVVQHGKRADAIVKNMLLHSRQGSQEHRPVDINAVVEESLNLAYHGARAEKQGFNITLERSFDPAAGEVDVFPQEITRVLLNLISNGFYAATRRKAEANGGNYEPTLAAATKNLGDSVEIRIRDNGTGIPPEVKDKMFNPFFTTKPVGEGTGLGLSISHDIIVKQHGGSIEVDTQPGEFTEFRIVLPRGAATIAKSGERA